jgi:hypothetical protein
VPDEEVDDQEHGPVTPFRGVRANLGEDLGGRHELSAGDVGRGEESGLGDQYTVARPMWNDKRKDAHSEEFDLSVGRYRLETLFDFQIEYVPDRDGPKGQLGSCSHGRG